MKMRIHEHGSVSILRMASCNVAPSSEWIILWSLLAGKFCIQFKAIKVIKKTV